MSDSLFMTADCNQCELMVKSIECTDKAKALLAQFPSPIVGRNRQFLTLLNCADGISQQACTAIIRKVDFGLLMDNELIDFKEGADIEYLLQIMHNQLDNDSIQHEPEPVGGYLQANNYDTVSTVLRLAALQFS